MIFDWFWGRTIIQILKKNQSEKRSLIGWMLGWILDGSGEDFARFGKGLGSHVGTKNHQKSRRNPDGKVIEI